MRVPQSRALDREGRAVAGQIVELMARLTAHGAHIHIPRADQDYAVEVGLRMLLLRHLVEEENGFYRANPREELLLRYYANSIAHLRRDETAQDLVTQDLVTPAAAE